MANPITPLTPEQFEHQEAQALKEGYVKRVLIGVDDLGNVVIDGHPDETISSHSARAAVAGKKWGIVMSKFLDFFQKDHGAKAEAGDTARAMVVINIDNSKGE
jgi:hypothetical protein